MDRIKKNLDIVIAIVFSLVCVSLLVPVLLNQTFKAELIFKTPPLSSYQKVQLMNLIRDHSDSGDFLQMDPEFIDTGIGLPTMNLSKSNELLPWELDTLKIVVISKIRDEGFIKKKTLDLLEDFYNQMIKKPNVSETMAREFEATDRQLKERRDIYNQALDGLRKDTYSEVYKSGRLYFLLGQTKATREGLLRWDIGVLNQKILELEQAKGGSSKVDIESLRFIDGSYKISAYGPHFKEFAIYCFVITIGVLIFIFDRRYRIKK